MAVTTATPPSPAWQRAAHALIDDLDDRKLAQLATYRNLILTWNERFNLTAIRTAEEIDFRLILESLRLWSLISGRSGSPPSGLSLIDIGSGSGIPGLPISIVAPDLTVVMVEATGKKAGFIQRVIDVLGLPNARVEHGRAEACGRAPESREMFNLAVARAVGSLPTLLELSLPLMRVGATAYFPKGVLDDDERNSGQAAALLLGGRLREVIRLPAIAGCPVTEVAIADKLGPIPERYPRRAGIPAKEPLKG